VSPAYLSKKLTRPLATKDGGTLVEELKEHRNYIAHEILADDAMMQKLAGAGARRFAWKSLERGLYTVEEVIVVHDFLAGNKLL
jgi:hypothetical protein